MTSNLGSLISANITLLHEKGYRNNVEVIPRNMALLSILKIRLSTDDLILVEKIVGKMQKMYVPNYFECGSDQERMNYLKSIVRSMVYKHIIDQNIIGETLVELLKSI